MDDSPPPGADRLDDPLPLSALQHQLFCPRQCALIHIERLWAENALTVEGRLLHERADTAHTAGRKGVTVARALPVYSRRHGLAGVADVVEFHGPRPYPVEYKRGRPKAHRADEVQLCAQALCLEEMCGHRVPEGALFYGQNRRRHRVAIDDGLRALTLETAAAARAMLRAGRTPPPVYERRKCASCSLVEDCQPQRLARPPAIGPWLDRQLRD